MIDVYCGHKRNTIVKTRAKIVKDIAFQIPCLECSASGRWHMIRGLKNEAICNN